MAVERRREIQVRPGGGAGAEAGGNPARSGPSRQPATVALPPGSQLANIRDIATGVRESARFYVELHKLGVNIQCFDVGGGLGVDYEGTRSQSDCSVNYGLNEYANNVIWGIGDACNEHGLPHPTVITESGRAVTAHHTVLVSNVIGVERNEFSEPLPPEADAARAGKHVGNPAGNERAGEPPLAARMAARQPDGSARRAYPIRTRHAGSDQARGPSSCI